MNANRCMLSSLLVLLATVNTINSSSWYASLWYNNLKKNAYFASNALLTKANNNPETALSLMMVAFALTMAYKTRQGQAEIGKFLWKKRPNWLKTPFQKEQERLKLESKESRFEQLYEKYQKSRPSLTNKESFEYLNLRVDPKIEEFRLKIKDQKKFRKKLHEKVHKDKED